MAVSLTDRAAARVRKIMDEKQLKPEDVSLRLGAKGGGCSGFSYLFDLDTTEPQASDKVCESHGIRLVIDKKSYFYLNGLEVDYEDSMLGGQFAFKNPNATATCGCGTSFSVAPPAAQPVAQEA